VLDAVAENSCTHGFNVRSKPFYLFDPVVREGGVLHSGIEAGNVVHRLSMSDQVETHVDDKRVRGSVRGRDPAQLRLHASSSPRELLRLKLHSSVLGALSRSPYSLTQPHF